MEFSQLYRVIVLVLSLALTLGQAPPEFSTPPCKPHVTVCEGLCDQAAIFLRDKRLSVSEGRGWSWYYENVLQYYNCMNAKVVVEIGAAWGSQSKYILGKSTTIQEYHIVDPFLGGYDKEDPMSVQFALFDKNSTLEDISKAWGESMGKALGVDGEGITPAGCKLRIHRTPSTIGAELFGDGSVDVVFVDGLHTYAGVTDDINAWRSKLKKGGAMIFNDYSLKNVFPGISRAVKEEANRQSQTIRKIDHDNHVLGGSLDCSSVSTHTQPHGK